MEPWKSRATYSRTKVNPSQPCKKHPNHKQSPGVCSICLNEKLFNLKNSSSSRSKVVVKRRTSLYSSSSLSSYSSDESSYSSPLHKYVRRLDSDNGRSILKKSRSMIFGKSVLKKSSSMASVLRTRKEKEGVVKKGFWSKFLPRRNKGLMHSRTTRE